MAFAKRAGQQSAAGLPGFDSQAYRPSYLAAALAAAAVFALYLTTLGPTIAMWDTPEYVTAAYIVGIPHPPGNPLFILLGRVFALLPIGGGAAMRINVLAALSSALTAGFWFLLAERILAPSFARRWPRIVGGALAALTGATAFTVWAQSVVNEKVYTVALFGLALVSWLVMRWADDPEAPNASRLLVLASYVTGLGYAVHMAGFLTLPAMGVVILYHRPRTLLRWRLMLACGAAVVFGISPFATQPIRAAHFPAINEGEPTACETKLAVSCTLSAKTYERFKYNFDRRQYAKPPLVERQAPFSAQLAMFWQYFQWQWLRDPSGTNAGTQSALAAVFLALGLVGGLTNWRRDRLTFVYVATLVVTLTIVLIYYMNFRYGASQSPELANTVDREPRDRDYFFLFAFSAWSVWVGIGLMRVWELVTSLFATPGSVPRGVPRGAPATAGSVHRLHWAAAPVLLIALVPLFGNWHAASRRGDTDTADFARDLLNSVEPYGILVTAGDNDMFPLWYAQEVEGVRRDVLVTNTSLMNTDWFVRQLIRRPVFDYDADTGPALYRNRTWPKPHGPALKMTLDDADHVPDFTQLTEPMQFESGQLRAIVRPQVLQRASLLVFQLIQDNPDRPVHFARSTGSEPYELGLGDYLVTYGLTRKLARAPVAATDNVRRIPGEGWVDNAATSALWNSFEAPASLIRKNRWIDQPSLSVPVMYVTTGIALTDSMLMRGDTAGSNAVRNRTQQMATALGLGEVFGHAAAPETLGDTVRKVGADSR